MPDLTLSALTLELARLSRDLDSAQRDLAKAEHDAVTTRHRADLAEARAYVAADGPVELRKRTALIETEQHLLDAEVADAAVKAARSRIATLRTKIDVGRTLIASARSEHQVANYSGAA